MISNVPLFFDNKNFRKNAIFSSVFIFYQMKFDDFETKIFYQSPMLFDVK
jgi:hypothetical protein